MIIDVIDMADRHLGAELKAKLTGSGSTIIELYGMSNGVGKMVELVKRTAQRYQSIEALRIWSHGSAGNQPVSSGVGGAFDWSSLAAVTIDDMKGMLKSLAPYFKNGARAELRGCNVGADEEGEDLLQGLAKVWRVRVQAAKRNLRGLDWGGPVVEATPDGTLRSTTGTPVR